MSVAAVVALASCPRRWDSASIQCARAVARPLVAKGDNASVVGFELAFLLENTSANDYKLYRPMPLYKRSRTSNALELFSADLSADVVIPAQDRAKALYLTFHSCGIVDAHSPGSLNSDPQQCLHDMLADAVSFVAIDEHARIRINLPLPVLSAVSRL